MWKALADPTRREILALLREGELSAGEIAAHFRISAPSVSRHLRVLREAGLIADRREGQNIIYRLDTTVFQDLLGWLREISGGRDDDGGGSER